MEKDFDIKAFNPVIKELNELAMIYWNITINWVDDVENYELCKKAIKLINKKNNEIKKVLKAKREDAKNYQKFIIQQEKNIIWITTGVSDNLKAEIEKINEAKEEIQRKELLPYRNRILKINNLTCSEELLLSFSEEDFSFWIIDQIEIAEREKKEQEKKEAELEKQKKEIEKAKQEAIIETEKRLKKEEQERILNEWLQKKIDEEDRILDKMKKEEQEKKDKKYQAWLKKNKYNNETDIIEYLDWKKAIFRLIDIYIEE